MSGKLEIYRRCSPSFRIRRCTAEADAEASCLVCVDARRGFKATGSVVLRHTIFFRGRLAPHEAISRACYFSIRVA